jgi:hypothetical protein
MPNPKMPQHNSRSFNPDKGLPLIAVRPGQSVGKGAAAKACEEHQVYDDGVQVKQVPNMATRKFHMKKK